MKADKNKAMAGQKNTGLRLKLLLPLTIILVLSLLGLSVIIINLQTKSLDNMGRQIKTLLSDSHKSVEHGLNQMKTSTSKNLLNMSNTAADQLAGSTNAALLQEKQKIKTGWMKFLEDQAYSTATLLAMVAPNAILNYDFRTLMNYSKSASANKNVVYAIYLKPSGKPYVRFFDKTKPKIQEYLSAGQGKKNYQKIINASQNDPMVFIVTKKLELEGKDVGSLVLCMSREEVNKRIKKMSQRFNFIAAENSMRIQNILGSEIQKVETNMDASISEVFKNNKVSAGKANSSILKFSTEVNAQTKNKIALFGALCCIVIFVAVWFLFSHLVTQPVKKIISGLKDIASGEGDLTRRLEIKTKDELGELAGWFNKFVERLKYIVVDINTNANTVSNSSGNLLNTIKQVAGGVDDLSDKANSVAAASEEMSLTMSSVAATTRQASENMGMVNELASQMQHTLGEVAVNCERARDISCDAATQVDNSSKRVELLGESARQISKVTEVITDIAEQTNLLALNATIEAARAGEAGKGFAVVAGEIKSLADQTAKATMSIKEKINGIQNSAKGTVQDVKKTSEVISQVNEIVATIAAAIEEQSASAREVAQNIDQASTGIKEVDENVAQTSRVSSEVSKDMSVVDSVADDISKKTDQIKQSALELSDLSLKLMDMISVFKVK